jgi:hypothetical protein
MGPLFRMSHSAAYLKSLHRKRLVEPGDFKSISGTIIMGLLVPSDFPKFVSEVAAMSHELRKGGTNLEITFQGDGSQQ